MGERDNWLALLTIPIGSGIRILPCSQPLEVVKGPADSI